MTRRAPTPFLSTTSRAGLLLCLLAGACGESAPVAAPPVQPASPAPTAAPIAAPTPMPTAVCAAVGFTEAEVVSDAAREANAAALRLMSGDASAAEAALAAVVASAPGYRMARYNHACALTRLGRLDEAWRAFVPLLCEELPTFAERLNTDEDLAPLRARTETSATLERIAAEYREAAREGAPLVAYTHGPARSEDDGPGTEWEESQAGVYVHSAQRFVPMGPRLRERGTMGASGNGGYALTATRYDAARGRVLSVAARGTDAEDPSLGLVVTRVLEAPLAREIAVNRIHTFGPTVYAQLTDEGAGVWYFNDELEERSITFPTPSARSPHPEDNALSVGPMGWYATWARMPASATEVTLRDGRTLTLGTAPRRRTRSVQYTANPDIVLVIHEVRGQCDVRPVYSVERWVVSSGVHSEVASGEGVAVVEDHEGVLYIQVGDTLNRYPDLGAGAAEVVRAGLGLTSMAGGFNPYC